MNEPVLQSSLGDVTSVKTQKDRSWNMGYLAMGRVIRVHPKRYTADVQLLKANNTVMSAKDQEGRHACRIGVGNAGYSDKFKKPYGEIIPIQVGSLVLVGFMKNSKEKPVILRVFHDIGEELGENNTKNILNAAYASDSDDSIDSYTIITPTQDFFRMDDEGNIEIGSHSKSFIAWKDRAMDDETFDYEDLETKDANQNTVAVEEKDSRPKKFMAVFRDAFSDSSTNWLKFIIDAAKTSLRIAKLQQAENKSTYIELTQEGGFRLRRQLDSKAFDDSAEKGQGSKQFSEFYFDPSGVFTFTSQKDEDNVSKVEVQQGGQIVLTMAGSTKTTVTLNSDSSGLTIETEEPINVKTKKGAEVEAEEDISVKCKNAKVECKTSELNAETSAKVKTVTASVESTTAEVETSTASVKASTVNVTSGTLNIAATTNHNGMVNITGNCSVNGRLVALVGSPVIAGPYQGEVQSQ